MHPLLWISFYDNMARSQEEMLYLLRYMYSLNDNILSNQLKMYVQMFNDFIIDRV